MASSDHETELQSREKRFRVTLEPYYGKRTFFYHPNLHKEYVREETDSNKFYNYVGELDVKRASEIEEKLEKQDQSQVKLEDSTVEYDVEKLKPEVNALLGSAQGEISQIIAFLDSLHAGRLGCDASEGVQDGSSQLRYRLSKRSLQYKVAADILEAGLAALRRKKDSRYDVQDSMKEFVSYWSVAEDSRSFRVNGPHEMKGGLFQTTAYDIQLMIDQRLNLSVSSVFKPVYLKLTTHGISDNTNTALRKLPSADFVIDIAHPLAALFTSIIQINFSYLNDYLFETTLPLATTKPTRARSVEVSPNNYQSFYDGSLCFTIERCKESAVKDEDEKDKVHESELESKSSFASLLLIMVDRLSRYNQYSRSTPPVMFQDTTLDSLNRSTKMVHQISQLTRTHQIQQQLYKSLVTVRKCFLSFNFLTTRAARGETIFSLRFDNRFMGEIGHFDGQIRLHSAATNQTRCVTDANRSLDLILTAIAHDILTSAHQRLRIGGHHSCLSHAAITLTSDTRSLRPQPPSFSPSFSFSFSSVLILCPFSLIGILYENAV
eukprot:TRINITY_DN5708_c0_g1_i2.p1 TRINITY_DN5708_c0_g1~~TRINITY_DN5708_c0_g1_i2.p1  ORF type:complete len:549 (+),score=98.55 TRINITY_DN5708_c0_g1_i2:68-1714(+)